MNDLDNITAGQIRQISANSRARCRRCAAGQYGEWERVAREPPRFLFSDP